MSCCRESGNLGGKTQSRGVEEACTGRSPFAVGGEKNELRFFQQCRIRRGVLQLLDWADGKVSRMAGIPADRSIGARLIIARECWTRDSNIQNNVRARATRRMSVYDPSR